MTATTERLDAITARLNAAAPGAITIRPSDIGYLLDLARKQAAALEAVDVMEEWAVQFANGSVEEADGSKDAHRKLYEIREAIVDGIETPAVEPMQVVRRLRVSCSELTAWKVVTQ